MSVNKMTPAPQRQQGSAEDPMNPRRSPRIAAIMSARNASGASASAGTCAAPSTTAVKRAVKVTASQSNVVNTMKPSVSGKGGPVPVAPNLNVSVNGISKKLSTLKIGTGSKPANSASSMTSSVSSTSNSALRHDSNNNVGASQTTATSKTKSKVNKKPSSSSSGRDENAENVPIGSPSSTKIISSLPSKIYQAIKPRKSLSMADSSLLRNFDPDVCKFCATELKAGEGIMLEVCLHVFCRDCLLAAIESQKEECQVKCPVADDEKCEGYLNDREVKELVPPAVYQEYLDRSLVIAKKKMKNVFNCKTEGCTSWCEFEEGRKTFDCPQCHKTNCMECDAIHTGVDCKIFQALSKSGQLSKVKELIKKETTNGWEQLTAIVKSSGDNGLKADDILQQVDILQNVMEFECSICLSDVAPGQGVILHECFHMFCKECLINLVEHNDEPTVKCPYIDGNYSCVSFMEPREIKALVPKDVHEKHLQRSEKLGESSMENSYHCKTPDCQGWCEYEAGARTFKCPRCRKMNCIACQAIHNGSCEDYKNRLTQNKNDKLSEEAVEKLIQTGQYMRCPKCKIPVQKTVGCDWIQCSACRTEICWVTRGPRWGPKGHGDTSGGCRCKVNGKKCHPKCGNCH